MNQQANFENNQSPQRISYLISSYISGSISPEEHDELDIWVGASDDNMRTFEEMTGHSKDKKEEGRKKYSSSWSELLYRPLRYSI